MYCCAFEFPLLNQMHSLLKILLNIGLVLLSLAFSPNFNAELLIFRVLDLIDGVGWMIIWTLLSFY
jgi:hypothetical protein